MKRWVFWAGVLSVVVSGCASEPAPDPAAEMPASAAPAAAAGDGSAGGGGARGAGGGAGGFASGNRQSVEIWYEGRACHNNASYTEHQEIGDWGIPFNMEVGNHNVVGRAPAGFTAVSAIKVGVMNIQGQFANQGISVRWMIAAGAGNGQAHNTHSLGNTNASPFPNTNSNSNHVYEANIFNLTGIH